MCSRKLRNCVSRKTGYKTPQFLLLKTEKINSLFFVIIAGITAALHGYCMQLIKQETKDLCPEKETDHRPLISNYGKVSIK